MAMKVTPPEANVINAVDVIEHILGRDGLIEQNKDILLKPILFNEITLEDYYSWKIKQLLTRILENNLSPS